MTPALRVGTRRSPLALAQTGLVVDRLRAYGYDVEMVPVTTLGDSSGAALTTIGGTGVFAGALREALSARCVDLAVHSLKDLPVLSAPGLTLAAIPVREDPRDVVVARDGLLLAELPTGAVVGTGSPRRAAQLRALGLGLVVQDVRGNVDTRLSYVADGRLDAVVLAYAGLARLGRLDAVTELLDADRMLPAPGQGALAVECRSDDSDLRALLGDLDDPHTRACVTAERALLAALEAGCTAPIGALAELDAAGQDTDRVAGAGLWLRAFAGRADGTGSLRRAVRGPLTDAAELGKALAATLLDEGARDIPVLSATEAAGPITVAAPSAAAAEVPLHARPDQPPTALSPHQPARRPTERAS